MKSESPRAFVTEEDGQIVLHDPDGLAMIQAVEKHNCKATLEMNVDRVRHFVERMRTLGPNADDVVIVLLNVDDPNGGALAKTLMPGYNWQEIRDRGEVPFARGLAGRDGIQGVLDVLDAAAADKLRGATEPSVVVLDHGVAEVFVAESSE